MRKLFSALIFCLIASLAHAVTAYYVSPQRTSNGAGTAASPWKMYSDINWTTVATALLVGEVDIYLDSRGTNSEAGTTSLGTTVTGTSGKPLKLFGRSFYCTGATGTAVWTAESSPYVAQSSGVIVNSGNLYTMDLQHSGSSLLIYSNQAYITLDGLAITNSAYGGVGIGTNGYDHTTNPAVNIHDLQISGCKIVSPDNDQGIASPFAQSGCTNWLFSGNYVYGTQSEGIYVTDYSYLTDNCTGIIVENNVVINCGLSGEGDIDIKPAAYGAIVRNNINYRTAPALGGGNSGVVCAANNCQIYGNRFYSAQEKADTDWGFGIYLNSEGDAATAGKAITACLIYNNLLYVNRGSGIRVLGTAANCTGIKVYSNTIYGNGLGAAGGMGIEIRSSTSPYPPNTQATVQVDSQNNIITGNVTFQCYTIGAGSSFTTSDYNIITGTGLCQLLGVTKTWAQWQSAGFDAHGLNTAATFTNAGTGDFTLQSGSAGATAGVDLSGTFTTDFSGATRTVPWSIGAYKAASTTTSSSSISGKVLLSGKVQIK